jgi:hypothetical protein
MLYATLISAISRICPQALDFLLSEHNRLYPSIERHRNDRSLCTLSHYNLQSDEWQRSGIEGRTMGWLRRAPKLAEVHGSCSDKPVKVSRSVLIFGTISRRQSLSSFPIGLFSDSSSYGGLSVGFRAAASLFSCVCIRGFVA